MKRSTCRADHVTTMYPPSLKEVFGQWSHHVLKFESPTSPQKEKHPLQSYLQTAKVVQELHVRNALQLHRCYSHFYSFHLHSPRIGSLVELLLRKGKSVTKTRGYARYFFCFSCESKHTYIFMEQAFCVRKLTQGYHNNALLPFVRPTFLNLGFSFGVTPFSPVFSPKKALKRDFRSSSENPTLVTFSVSES